ncbi:MAG TPA: peptidylprolyl isomerase [Longimicrobiales bacterium]
MKWMICCAAAVFLGAWNAHAPGGGPTAAAPGSRTAAPSGPHASGAAASGRAPSGTTAIEGCTPEQKRLLLDPTNPEWRRRAPDVYRARFETTKGVFVVEAVRAYAPIGADRFYNLVRLCYYDDARFHRVSRGYIAQFGLHGDPAVNRAWMHQQIPDDPRHGSNVRGTLAFAMTPEPNTRNTQVYINLGDNTRNDREPFAIFGRVVEGMDVLDRLYAGYGERSGGGLRQGRQGPIIEGGNAYLDREFPLLDRIIRATIVDVPSQ